MVSVLLSLTELLITAFSCVIPILPNKRAPPPKLTAVLVKSVLDLPDEVASSISKDVAAPGFESIEIIVILSLPA